MRVLLSTIGTRGDVQPLVALAMELKVLGHEARLCVPPDFRDWLEGMRLPVATIGPELRAFGKAKAATPPTPEQQVQLVELSVATQFETLEAAARGCDAIVGATALQIAAPSIAERMGIPYVFAAYCPTVLPSAHHAPPFMGVSGDEPAPADYADLWAQDAQRFNSLFGAALNGHRASRGLAPVSDVRSHILHRRPWLAADQTLAPWPEPDDETVLQTGAWILPDERPLPDELEEFLAAGEPPIYFGFGSMCVAEGLSQVVIATARSLGRRAILLRGWADLALVDEESDCMVLGEVNQQALFRRVAAVVHHGGAGTTTAAARAGASQVIVSQLYDQQYWARRIEQLGIGIAHAPGTPSQGSLASALERALRSDVAVRAQAIATRVRTDGAQRAAQCFMTSLEHS